MPIAPKGLENMSAQGRAQSRPGSAASCKLSPVRAVQPAVHHRHRSRKTPPTASIN